MALVVTWFLTTHYFHVFSESINWDEFALLERADRTLRLGRVDGGGRPGFVTLLLIPFVRDCVDSVQAVVNARVLWLLPTLAYLGGVYLLVRRWHSHGLRAESGQPQALLAIALLAFLPAFITWSVQVRTDQFALAFAVWGGCLLLSLGNMSAIGAGTLFALSFLCTQKAIYPIALTILLYSTSLVSRLTSQQTSLRKEALRAARRLALSFFAALLVVGLYLSAFPEAASLASSDSVGSSMQTMQWTRTQQGYRVYTIHAGRLVVHWALFLLLVLWSCAAILRRRNDQYIPVFTCWLVLGLGAVVIKFHGSSFPYFVMTAGLFPAVALSLTTPTVLQRAGRLAWPTLVALIVLAALQSSRETLEMFVDTQAEQRKTLELIYESALIHRRGYQVEGALFCAKDPSPIPPLFSEGIARRFFLSKDSAQNTKDFVEEFRNRPIAYIVESFRLQRFPKAIRRFLGEHYVWYGKSLYLAGFRIEFASKESRVVDVIVPATYRWTPDPSAASASIIVNGRVLDAFGEIELQVGQHQVEATVMPTVGSLILADLPARERQGYPAFYHQRQYLQLRGLR